MVKFFSAFVLACLCSCCSIPPGDQLVIDAARNPGQRVCKLIQHDKVEDVVVTGIYCIVREGAIDPSGQ